MVRKENKIDVEGKINDAIKALKGVLSIDKVILFGSYAKGNPHEYSDIDLLILSSDLSPDVPKLKYLREIKDKANLFDPDLQLFLYPTEVFEKEKCVEKSFIKEIKNTGKVIYCMPHLYNH